MQIYGKITDISKPNFDINGFFVHRFSSLFVVIVDADEVEED